MKNAILVSRRPNLCSLPRFLPLVVFGFVQFAGAAPASSRPAESYYWRNVQIGGGGFVTGIIFSSAARNLIYLRTDIGGAYRWDAHSASWFPLLDWLDHADTNLLGVESLATDLLDPDRVYVAVGTYTNPRAGNGALLRSADRGRTWKRTRLPFKLGANEIGRANGERLAVDPNDDRILFLGTRTAGLWRSSDFGATWQPVRSFPAVPGTADNTSRPGLPARFHFPPQPVGLVVVQFDRHSGKRGRPTPVVYVAASTSGLSLFRTKDGGRTWAPLPGQPTGLRPNRLALAADGMLYISYGREPGPNTMTDGAVWKFDTRRGAWTDITPVRPSAVGEAFGYAAVAVDAAHPRTVMVTTLYHRNEIYRSTDGGKSWRALLDQARWDHSVAPYTKEMHPHWMADLAIDPFDPNHVIFATGYGIWATRDATAADADKPTHWTFDDRGLEETVPLAIISPPEGAHLLSGLGDIDGFRHNNLNVSPPQGTFKHPHFANTESMDFAAHDPEMIVRSGTIRNFKPGQVRAAFSLDGGQTWEPLASEPPPATGMDPRYGGAGHICVSADGRTIVWAPRGSVPHLTRDRGRTWHACAGTPAGLAVVADRVNPRKFYGYDTQSGVVLVSTDGARTFHAEARGLPKEQGFWFPVPGDLHAVPGHEGDLWLAAGGALFDSQDGGAHFAQEGAVHELVTVGFGRGRPHGDGYPAVYVVGAVGGAWGIFRSDDAGANWVRISDARHAYGSTIHITGDPRIYGRVYLAVAGRGVIYGDPAGKTRHDTNEAGSGDPALPPRRAQRAR